MPRYVPSIQAWLSDVTKLPSQKAPRTTSSPGTSKLGLFPLDDLSFSQYTWMSLLRFFVHCACIGHNRYQNLNSIGYFIVLV